MIRPAYLRINAFPVFLLQQYILINANRYPKQTKNNYKNTLEQYTFSTPLRLIRHGLHQSELLRHVFYEMPRMIPYSCDCVNYVLADFRLVIYA